MTLLIPPEPSQSNEGDFRMTTRPEAANPHRRHLLGVAAITIAAAQLAAIGSAAAQSGKVPEVKPGTNTSFAPLKQIDSGVLNVGYAEAGPSDGPVVFL